MNKQAKLSLIITVLLVMALAATTIYAAKKECNNGIDDDGDGAVDLADGGCNNPGDNDETNCGDGVCEGGETQGSCAADCTPPECNDGTDNDGDGATDYPADFSCSSATDNDETNPLSQCQDGVDNDNDGWIDLVDLGCSGSQDNTESHTGSTECSDETDNDGDSLVDGNDPKCSVPTDDVEAEECRDGSDNDGDGHTDNGADSECVNADDDDESPKDSCSDSDGGIQIFTVGTASGDNNDIPFSFTDSCLDNSTLREYSCLGISGDYNSTFNDFDCGNSSNSCTNGACVF